jgi:superfamily II DNA or RNA helicase
MAKVELPDDKRLEVLRLYVHESRSGEAVANYYYKDGVAFLPLNKRKLQQVSEILGEPLIDERSLGNELVNEFKLNSTFKFRPHQTAPAYSLLEFVRNNQYAVLKAPCSCGKTVVMTWVAGNIGKKTLVLVDQGNLAGQWQEAFMMVWNHKATVLDAKNDLSGDVVIATFQYLHKHPELVKRMKDMFGTCLLDECHINAAKTYRNVLFRLNNYYRIGTSATVMRKGYSEEILTDLIADVSVEMVDDKALVPEIRFIDTKCSFWSNNPDNFTKTMTKLSENADRNQLILNLIRSEVKQGRKVLFVGSRIESLKYLHSQLDGCKAVCYIGSTTLAQDKALKTGLEDGSINVILADKKVEKGVDLPDLDVVIIARPMNNQATVTQIVGRVLRPVEGKPQPIVYDLVDHGSLAWTFARNRFWWYKRLKYKFDKPTYFFLDRS